MSPVHLRDIVDPALGPGLMVTGSEQLGYANVYGTGAAAGKAFSSSPTSNSLDYCFICPNELPTTQMGTFASMFSFYRFKSIAIRYVPSVATDVSASLVMAVVFDSEFSNPGMTTPTYSLLSMNMYSVQTTAWKPVTLKIMRCPRVQNAYYCDEANSAGDLREVRQLCFSILCDNTTEKLYGRLYLDYVIELYGRTSSTSLSTVGARFNSLLRHPALNDEERAMLKGLAKKCMVSETLSSYPSDVVKVDISRAGGAALASTTSGAVPVTGLSGSSGHALQVLTTFPDTVSTAYSGEFSQIPASLSAPLPTVNIDLVESKYQENPKAAAPVTNPPTPALMKRRP